MSTQFMLRSGVALAAAIAGSILISVSAEDVKMGALAFGVSLLLYAGGVMLGSFDK